MSQSRLLTFEFFSLCTNANMLMLAVHCGSFLGPVVGGWLIAAGGYDLFFGGAMGVTVVAAGGMLVVRPG